MQEILRQLFDGDIRPAEQFYPKTEEYKALHREYHRRCENFARLLEKSAPELSREFSGLADAEMELQNLEISEMFAQGFRLGAKLALSVCDDAPGIKPAEKGLTD